MVTVYRGIEHLSSDDQQELKELAVVDQLHLDMEAAELAANERAQSPILNRPASCEVSQDHKE